MAFPAFFATCRAIFGSPCSGPCRVESESNHSPLAAPVQWRIAWWRLCDILFEMKQSALYIPVIEKMTFQVFQFRTIDIS